MSEPVKINDLTLKSSFSDSMSELSETEEDNQKQEEQNQEE